MSIADELCELLVAAAELVSDYGEMNLFCPFDSGSEFADEIQSLKSRVASGDLSATGKLVGIFAPTGAWDDGVGRQGMQLADRIMTLLDDLKQTVLPVSRTQV